MRCLPLAVMLCCTLFSPAAARAAADEAAAKAIDAWAKPLLSRDQLWGQLLVTRHGHVVVERSWGVANAELGVLVTPDTRFNIASVTKPFTATLAIQLAAEGRLRVSDSLARWFPDFPKADSITVSMLLRHRSGIPHEVVPDSEATRPFTAEELVQRAQRLPLDFPPGARESYSSGGFEVLARVLERVSEESYDALLEERIFHPLNMTHSASADSRTILPGRATGYVPGQRGIENAPLVDFSSILGAGSVWSTARDLSRFVDSLVAGRLGEGPRRSFDRNGRLDFNGRTGGFKAWVVRDSASGIAACFLSNLATGAPDALRGAILELSAGRSVASPTVPALAASMPSEAELRRWEGVFQIANGGPRLSLHVRNGELYANDWLLQPTADGAMFSPRDYGLVRAVPAADGSIDRLDWTQSGKVYAAPRVSGR